jgi:ATP synthase protein I
MSSNDKDDRKSRGEIAPEERDSIHQRSTDLGRKLEAARQGPVAGANARRAADAGKDRGEAMGRALRVSAELIGGIVVGSLIGSGLDRWLGLQKPWFFILFFLLGAASGILNVIRMAMREKKTPALPSVPDDEDAER